jgi:hypothetical protein
MVVGGPNALLNHLFNAAAAAAPAEGPPPPPPQHCRPASATGGSPVPATPDESDAWDQMEATEIETSALARPVRSSTPMLTVLLLLLPPQVLGSVQLHGDCATEGTVTAIVGATGGAGGVMLFSARADTQQWRATRRRRRRSSHWRRSRRRRGQQGGVFGRLGR